MGSGGADILQGQAGRFANRGTNLIRALVGKNLNVEIQNESRGGLARHDFFSCRAGSDSLVSIRATVRYPVRHFGKASEGIRTR